MCRLFSCRSIISRRPSSAREADLQIFNSSNSDWQLLSSSDCLLLSSSLASFMLLFMMLTARKEWCASNYSSQKSNCPLSSFPDTILFIYYLHNVYYYLSPDRPIQFYAWINYDFPMKIRISTIINPPIPKNLIDPTWGASPPNTHTHYCPLLLYNYLSNLWKLRLLNIR